MILDSITLTDFGLYAGRQSIPLTPPAPDKPVILFGGLNGGGKTTLLDALQLCLFGARAKTSGRGKLGYREYLARCIHEGSGREEAGIQIGFRHTSEGEEDRYLVRRSWRRVNGRAREEFHVLKNDRPAPAIAENWSNQVEDLFPANIAHLFLFDGEQIERYAVPSYSGALVGTAIQNLLGLDVVDQLVKDVRVFERRKRTERMDDEAREQLAIAEKGLESLRAKADGIRQDRASLRNARDRRKRDLAAAEESFRRLGGELFERRQTIERELEDAWAGLEASAEALRGLAAGALPIALLGELLERAAARDRADQATARARQVGALLTERDAETLAHLQARTSDDGAVAALREYLAENRASHSERAGRPTVLDMTEQGRNALSGLVHGQLEESVRMAEEARARHAQLASRVEEATVLHDSVPQGDAVGEAMERRALLKVDLARLDAEEVALTDAAGRLEREIARAEAAVARKMETEVRDRERRDDHDRVLDSAGKVRATLAAFHTAIVRRHISSIEHLVLQSYQQLLRKTSLVTRLAIDPEGFGLTLYGRSGDIVRAEALSAGERQLLGIALLWGLGKASGRPLPTAIDTPLGRLDTEHRRHFVERYLPFASHQTLVFSTDEEIVGDYLERLAPWVGRSYYLNYDDEAGSTRVEPGYFDGERTGVD